MVQHQPHMDQLLDRMVQHLDHLFQHLHHMVLHLAPLDQHLDLDFIQVLDLVIFQPLALPTFLPLAQAIFQRQDQLISPLLSLPMDKLLDHIIHQDQFMCQPNLVPSNWVINMVFLFYHTMFLH